MLFFDDATFTLQDAGNDSVLSSTKNRAKREGARSPAIECENRPSSSAEDTESDEEALSFTESVLRAQRAWNLSHEEHGAHTTTGDGDPGGKTVSGDKSPSGSPSCPPLAPEAPGVLLPPVSEAFASTRLHFRPSAQEVRGSEVLVKKPGIQVIEAPPRTGDGRYALPEVGTWHVPLTYADALINKRQQIQDANRYGEKQRSSRRREVDALRLRAESPPTGYSQRKVGGGGAETGDTQLPSTSVASHRERPLGIKDREKLKRHKGQSTHTTWKPEMWMRLRQNYDS